MSTMKLPDEFIQYLLHQIPFITVKNFTFPAQLGGTVPKFLDALQENYTIEGCDIEYCFFGEHNDRLKYYCRLNQGGRRVLKEENFDKNLWSLVLARANKVLYDTDRPNVIYHLVRHGVADSFSG